MRRIDAMKRNRNGTLVYMVIRDTKAETVSVFQESPNGGGGRMHCRTYSYSGREEMQRKGWLTEERAVRKAILMATALSKMADAELLKQIDNVRRFGEVR